MGDPELSRKKREFVKASLWAGPALSWSPLKEGLKRPHGPSIGKEGRGGGGGSRRRDSSSYASEVGKKVAEGLFLAEQGHHRTVEAGHRYPREGG